MKVGHVHGANEVTSRNLVFSCRTPLIHPFAGHRFNDIIGLKSFPLEKRKVVLMMPRDGSNGTQILNQDALNAKTLELLQSRGKNETFKIFRQDEFQDIEEIISFISENVKLLIAPHGGALYNVRFASPSSAVLEIMPKGRFQPVFWEQSRLFEHHYYVYLCNSVDNIHNMALDDVQNVVSWINIILHDQEHGATAAVESDYKWYV
jgi:hypothetical protein